MSSERRAVAAGTWPEKQPHLQLPDAEEAAGRGGLGKPRGSAAIRDHAVFHRVPTAERAGGGRGCVQCTRLHTVSFILLPFVHIQNSELNPDQKRIWKMSAPYNFQNAFESLWSTSFPEPIWKHFGQYNFPNVFGHDFGQFGLLQTQLAV